MAQSRGYFALLTTACLHFTGYAFAQDDPGERHAPRLLDGEGDYRLSEFGIGVTVAVGASLDYWGGSELTSSTRFREAFDQGTGGSLEFSSHASLPIPELFGQEDLILGFRLRGSRTSFRGNSTSDDAMGDVGFDRLQVDTYTAGVLVGVGSYDENDCNWYRFYGVGQIGSSAYHRTRYTRSLPAIEERRFVSASHSLAASVGAGIEGRLEGWGIRLEGGFRTFGRPNYGSSVTDESDDYLNTVYLELGLSYSF